MVSALRTRWRTALALVALATGCSGAPIRRRASVAGFEVHGHRGARGLRPESTLAGFEHAIELGVDAIELDLHRSADGALIVWHDSAITPERCQYGGSLAHSDVLFSGRAPIATLTREQLRVFDCRTMAPDAALRTAPSARHGPASFALVTLDELFAFAQGLARDPRAPTELRERATRVRFNIELKRGWNGDRADGAFEASVLRTIAAHAMGHRVLLQSFDIATLRALRAGDGVIATSFLSNADTPAASAIARAREVRAQYWSPALASSSAAAVAEAHRAGLRVLVWTVNAEDELRAVRAMGADGVITDRPDRVLRALGR